MWTPFVFNEDTYLIRIKPGEPIKILLTNMKTVFYEELDNNQLFTRFKENNPLLELDEENAITKIYELVENLNSPTKLEEVEEEEIVGERGEEEEEIVERRGEEEGNRKCILLQISNLSNELNIKINYEFKLKQGDTNMFFNEVTVPLIHTVQYLEIKQKDILDDLRKKEQEIREYQLEKGNISRESRVTQKFDADTLNVENELLLLKTFTFKSDAFFQCFNKKNGDLFAIAPEIKKESPKKRKLNKPYVPKTNYHLNIRTWKNKRDEASSNVKSEPD